MRRAALEPFENCKNVLKQLDQALSVQYQKTNNNIFNNSNPHFKVGAKNNFTIATPKQEDEAVDLLKPYFGLNPIKVRNYQWDFSGSVLGRLFQ